MTTASVGALAICVASALLEGVAAGRGVKQRFAELQLPRFSPPLAVWVGIGLLYYVICFVISYRLLSAGVGFSQGGGAFGLAAWIFLPYVLYLGYALWWARRLWQLNGSVPR